MIVEGETEKVESVKIRESQGDVVNYVMVFRHSNGERVKVDTQLDLNDYIAYHKKRNFKYN